jgi:inosine-uridine nucleoside N-ribohydrolase
MAKQKILIDCDPGHDDLVAILFAARHMDLVGVTTVHGNNTLANTTRNGLIALELGDINTPLAAGASEPLVQKSVGIAPGHGKGGLDGHVFADPIRQPITQHAVDFIIEMAERHQGELILATIGPETNLALAIKREPRLRTWVREIAIMGGSTTLGNFTPVAEFNIAADIEAASVVFESGIPLRMVGYNITRQTGFDIHDIGKLRGSGRPACIAIADLMAFYLNRQTEMYGLTIAPMHDVCAIMPYVRPDLINFLETSARIELTGTYTRGMTVCDLRHPRGSAEPSLRNRTEPNAQVATSAKSRELIDHVIETLLTY